MYTIKHLTMSSLTVICLCIGAGCATLPDISKISDQRTTQSTPRILSVNGMLSPQKSKAIIERLKEPANPTDLLQRHNAVMEMVSGTPLTKGNRVTLLINGESTYAAMFKAIENAKESINVETYKIDADGIGSKFFGSLLKKQLEGVQVNFMYDSIGSLTTPPSFFNRLRQAGIQVVEVNPLIPVKQHAKWLSTHADHRKMLIADGKLAIIGGINISQVYASAPFQSEKGKKPSVPWRDTDIQLEGPVAAELQKFFVDMWSNQKGPDLSGRKYFPKLKEQGSALVRAICSRPGENNRITYISYASAFSFAEHSIYLTNAYFIPDDRILDELNNAASRGVDVKVILPSITDSSLALYAMRYNYSKLLKSGVHLYERRKALLHSKTTVIDDVWSTVGSTNMDLLSLSNNYELDAIILSREFAAEMQHMFARDLAESEPIRLEKWEKRSVLERAKELFAHMLSRVM